MKKLLAILISVCMILALMPASAFAASAQQGKILTYSSQKDITGLTTDNGSNSSATLVRMLLTPPTEDFDLTKLSAYKATFEYGDKTVILDLFEDGHKADYSSKLSTGNNDGILETHMSAEENLEMSVNFDPIHRYWMTGATVSGAESCHITASWTYDGTTYEAETTVFRGTNYKTYATSVLTCEYSGKTLLATSYGDRSEFNESDVKTKAVGNDKIYMSFCELGQGTMEYTGCTKDTSGTIFKNIKGYFSYAGVKEAMNILCIDPTDIKDGTYTLNFKDSTGTTRSFQITFVKKIIKNFKVSSLGTTKATVTWDLLDGAKAYKVQTGTGYKETASDVNTLTFENMDPGTAFDFTVCAQFTDDQKSNYWTVKSHVIFATKPLKVTGLKLTTGSKYVKASWTKKAGAGYQVQLALNKSFTSGKKSYTITSSDTLTKKVTSLTKGKKYYARVRAYSKDANGKKYYGSWSDVKYITCK